MRLNTYIDYKRRYELHSDNNLSKQQRECALYIEPFGDEKSFSMSAQDPTAEKLDDYTEIYVAAADFSWTYIKTHEGDWCGPYFYRKEK